MKVLVHSDANVHVSDDLVAHIELDLRSALARFGDRLTRVEVYLRDESAGRRTGDDIRCLVEARPAGQPPVAVSEHAPLPTSAFEGAVDKLVTLLETKFGRMQDRDRRDTIRGSDPEA